MEKNEEVKPDNNKLELEAEMGRLFLHIEKLKAEQQRAAVRLNQILKELENK